MLQSVETRQEPAEDLIICHIIHQSSASGQPAQVLQGRSLLRASPEAAGARREVRLHLYESDDGYFQLCNEKKK